MFDSTNLDISAFLYGYSKVFNNDPYLLNQRIKNLKTRPEFLKRDIIEDSLTAPDTHERELRTATRSMLYLTYPLYRLQMLYEGILTYKDYLVPVYTSKEEMNTKRFKSDWLFTDMWKKKLNAEKQFRRITAEVLAEGKKAYYFRQSYNATSGKEHVDYVHFQDLPSDWYKIIKHSTDSYAVVAFNFAYFWQAGTSLDQFPPIFTKYYNELAAATTKDNNGRNIIDLKKVPEDAIVEYDSNTLKWFYWRELPSDECFVFSYTESDDLQFSPFASLLLQAQDLSSYSLLQQQLLAVPLYSMLLGEIPMSKDNQSGSHIDDYALSPQSVDLFEGKVNSNLPPGTTYNMVPTENNQLYHFEAIPNSNEIYDKGLQQMINTAGVSTLMTTTNKPSIAQVNAGKIIEKRFVDRIYAQFAWAINIILNKMYCDGDLKFRWKYRIFGDSFSETEEKKSLETSLSMGQLELLPKYLAYNDMTLLDAVTCIDFVDNSEIYDKFKPVVSSFNSAIGKSGSGTGKVGRPRIDENQIESDNTAASIDAGTNVSENRSFNSKKCVVCGNETEESVICEDCLEEMGKEVE